MQTVLHGFGNLAAIKEMFIIIVKGILSISWYSLRTLFGIEFVGPTTLWALILLIISVSEISFSVTGFSSDKFMFEFLR